MLLASGRRVPPLVRRALVTPDRLNEIWALDSIHDALYRVRRFRTLNVVDEGNLEGLAIEVGTSIPAARVVRLLDQLVALCGRPHALRLDNGPGLTAKPFDESVLHGFARLDGVPGNPVPVAPVDKDLGRGRLQFKRAAQVATAGHARTGAANAASNDHAAESTEDASTGHGQERRVKRVADGHVSLAPGPLLEQRPCRRDPAVGFVEVIETARKLVAELFQDSLPAIQQRQVTRNPQEGLLDSPSAPPCVGVRAAFACTATASRRLI